MKSKKYNETWYINNFRKEIEIKYFCHTKAKFRHSDFIRLSEEIYKVSKIQLGINTLKRFFDIKNPKNPHLSTLDALAKYLEYENWNDYKQKQLKNEIIIPPIKYKSLLSRKKYIITAGIIIGMVLLAVVYFVYKKYKNIKNIENLEFYYTYENKKELPLVKFHFNIKNIDFENAKIWPLGIRNDAIDIKYDDTVLVYGYGWYETFHPKLVIDGDVVKELIIDVQSDGWKAAVSKLTKDEFFQEYWEDEAIFTKGDLGITDEILELHGFSYNDIEMCYYVNARNFENINGDTLFFETKIKNKQISKSTKSGIHKIFLVFEKGIILLPVAEEKRSNLDIPLGLFDVWMSPDKNDLTMLKINLLEWNRIIITTGKKKVEIVINDKQVYTNEFNLNPGFLKRVEFQFTGLGQVDYVRFYNTNGKLIYNDDFE